MYILTVLCSLTIKGQANEEAVLCTSNKTYAVRSVVLSNSVLLVTRPPDDAVMEGDVIVIRDQVNEILELVPSVPKLHKLGALLRGMEYEEEQEHDMDEDRSVSTFYVLIIICLTDVEQSARN